MQGVSEDSSTLRQEAGHPRTARIGLQWSWPSAWDLFELVAGDLAVPEGWDRSWCFPHGSSILPNCRASWELHRRGGLGYGWSRLSGLSLLA